MNAVPQPVWTIEEFIAWENEQEGRHEFCRGEIFAMSGGRRAHGCVVGNLMRHFGNQLAGTPCRAFSESMKVQMANEAITYPDVFVTCNRADLRTDQIFYSPTLVIEVLSPSTQAYDRSLKFAMYRGLASLCEYILIDPDTKRIEAFRRGADGLWDLHDQSDTGQLEAASVGVRISHAEVFDGVDLPAEGVPPADVAPRA